MSRLLTAFALVVMLMTSIAPAFATQGVDGTRTLVICTTFGVERITLDDNGNRLPTPQPIAAKQHCPFCLLPNAHFIAPLHDAPHSAPRAIITTATRRAYDTTQSYTRPYTPSHAIRGSPPSI